MSVVGAVSALICSFASSVRKVDHPVLLGPAGVDPDRTAETSLGPRTPRQ